MKTRLLCAMLAAPLTVAAANSQLLGWNNLGMHCMDSDYSVFSVLPPYNTIEAQLIVGGKLITNGAGYTVTYQAVADPDGSFNSTAHGKGNFYQFAQSLYGASLSAEMGLAGWPMPGTNNTPIPMLFESTNRPAPGVATRAHWFRAEGIPIAPYDDTGRKNPYPLMRVIARNGAGTALATNDIVLPVSDEMDCRACHASGTQGAARPAAGWTWSSNPERDFRLNILRLHDERQFANVPGLYQAALAARGFNPQGLYRGVVADGKPVLCAVCHASEALGTGSYSNIPPLTASVHAKHANVVDPDLGITLDHSSHRAACYRCHPGSATRCLRGAMGGSVARDGTMSMQCQSCHGNMSQVGSLTRVGWFMEPNCQSCHTGTAMHNNGEIRYTSCFETNGDVRLAVDPIFATTPDTPAPGLSLYRFSFGHGGLQCSACHGSTHAEFPATHRNDNLRNIALQGHSGVMVECSACHVSMPVNSTTATGGPHGMHPVSQAWANQHGDLIEGGLSRTACRACHGALDRGTVLSRSKAKRTITTPENKFGTKNYWLGRTVSCYDCHNGANSTDPTTHPPAIAQNVSTNTTSGLPVAMTLKAGGATVTYRIVSQPANGSVAVSNDVATYFPEPGYVGTARFTFTAWNNWVDSNLATGTVSVAQGPFSVSVVAATPPSYPAAWPVPFAALATASNTTAAITYDWNFGDGSPASHDRYAAHIYAAPGSYNWTLTARAATAIAVASGVIVIGPPADLSITRSFNRMIMSWPDTSADVVLEQSASLALPVHWLASTNVTHGDPDRTFIEIEDPVGISFYRLRHVQ